MTVRVAALSRPRREQLRPAGPPGSPSPAAIGGSAEQGLLRAGSSFRGSCGRPELLDAGRRAEAHASQDPRERSPAFVVARRNSSSASPPGACSPKAMSGDRRRWAPGARPGESGGGHEPGFGPKPTVAWKRSRGFWQKAPGVWKPLPGRLEIAPGRLAEAERRLAEVSKASRNSSLGFWEKASGLGQNSGGGASRQPTGGIQPPAAGAAWIRIHAPPASSGANRCSGCYFVISRTYSPVGSAEYEGSLTSMT